MTKAAQQEWLQQLGLPVPPFRTLDYQDYQQYGIPPHDLHFPLVVRSSFSSEDSAHSSYAGHFTTITDVQPEQLSAAIEEVFASYPDANGEVVLIQEQITADYSGVLFAWQKGIWRLELVQGPGEQLVSGAVTPDTYLLPRFSNLDAQLIRWVNFWRPPGISAVIRPALVRLSTAARVLLAQSTDLPGLDLEFCIRGGQLWLLQARPLTTPEEEEVLLTSANHKEILPERPSALMRDLIQRAGHRLFTYYRQFDARLPDYSFIHLSAGMPWINLSALLDTMVQWGLPTNLVTNNVGAQDPYRVGLRPWRILGKSVTFLRLAFHQLRAVEKARSWLEAVRSHNPQARAERAALWTSDAEQALQEWLQSAESTYVGLVDQMQALTAAASGSLSLLHHLGLSDQLAIYRSTSSDFFLAYQQLQHGQMERAEFLRDYGHRAFYESDLGERRFQEWTPTEWDQALAANVPMDLPVAPRQSAFLRLILFPIARPLLYREALRHEAMRLFAHLRSELLEAIRKLDLPINPFEWSVDQLANQLVGQAPGPGIPPANGWDMDTFLANRTGRRLAISNLSGLGTSDQRGIGIYPGKVRGQVWRVRQAGLTSLSVPPFSNRILVADALNPGFIPYFTNVSAVAAYTGGLLSHASIILREQRIPSVTQIAADVHFETGDWVELDGTAGTIQRVVP